MVDVSAEVGQMVGLDAFTGPTAAAVLDAAGWTGERRNAAKECATTWRLTVLIREVGDAAGGWLAFQRGVSAVVIVGVQPSGEGVTPFLL